MTVAAIMSSAVAAGIRMKIDGDRLVLSAPSRPDHRLLEDLRREKPKIVEYLRGLAAWSDEDWLALMDERAGIMEFDGGLSRAEAEDSAKGEVTALRRRVECLGDG